MTPDRSACPAPPGRRRHGTAPAYDQGCRCPDAREANRLRKKRAREGRALPGRVPHLATTRRMQALAALGWPLDVLADELGMHPSHVKDLRINRRTETVYRSTAVKVAAVYERLSMTPGPSERVRRYAERQGWAPPLAWYGIDLNDPAAQPRGHRPRPPASPVAPDLVERAERLYAELKAAQPYGGPATWSVVAARLGVKPKALEKARERARRRDVA